jgi:hypothetical protein
MGLVAAPRRELAQNSPRPRDAQQSRPLVLDKACGTGNPWWMGSRWHRPLERPERSAVGRTRVLVLSIAAGVLVPGAALAQSHADAGAARRSPSAAMPGERRLGSPSLKSIPNASSVLSEGVRARLAERAAARHPSELAAHDPASIEKPGSAASPAAAPAPVLSEPLRRGIAHQRRVQALDTGNGITVLSNRVTEPPAPRLASVRRSASGEAELAADPPVLASDESSVTETRSLRALSTRGDAAKAREGSLGLGGLVWPFVLLLATGAVVGTLWFSKKTE